MASRLRTRESVAEGLHRIVREEFAGAQAELQTLCDSPEREETIHETRKHLKRLRALCILWRSPLGPDLWRQEKAILSDLGQDLSAVRDIQVRVAVLKKVLRDSDSNGAAGRCQRVVAGWEREVRRRQEEASRPEGVAKSLSTLCASAARFELVPLQQDGWELLSESLRRSYRQARKCGAEASENGAGEAAWHAWRKRVKRLLYQLHLFEGMEDHALHREVKGLDHLAECLGEDRDLALLEAALLKRAPSLAAPQAKLTRFITRRRLALQQKSRRIGERLFEEKPRQFMHRLEKRWKKWRG